MQTASDKVYRLDSFIVPTRARDEFLNRVQETHALLKAQPGFIQDFLLEQPVEGEAFKLVTLVEWASPAVIEAAKAAVQAHHERTAFKPHQFFESLGVEAKLSTDRSSR